MTQREKVLAFVYDDPSSPLIAPPFPADACAEWESEQTIQRMVETWKELGFRVLMLPLNDGFLREWSKSSHEIDLVHSVVEGWGAIAREAWLPSLCELSGIPYIGSSPLAMAVSMKKSLLKRICHDLGIPTASFFPIRKIEDLKTVPSLFFEQRHFIKPDCEGSGMGVDASHSLSSSYETTFKTCSELLSRYPDGVLLEEYLAGREFTSALVGTPLRSLPLAEIEVETGVYGLSNKSKLEMGEKVTFPSVSESIEKIVNESGQKLANELGFLDFVRFDWKMDNAGNIFFLEANPLAGLSYYYSVLPKMAEQVGLSYGALFETLAVSALSRKEGRHLWYGKALGLSKRAD